MKIALITDSTAYFTPEQKACYPIEIVPINIMFEGKVYRDNGIDLTTSLAYQFLEKNPEDWSSSAPSPGDFLAAFKKVAGQGAKEIICLTIATKISATWNSARMAKNLAKNELPDVKIEVIDSGTGAIGETLIVIKLGQAIEKGKNFEELLRLTEELKKKIRVFLILETIRYIYRSGRIPEVASKIGGILPLKPTLTLHGGKLHFAGATISKDKSREKVLQILKETFDSSFPELALVHIDSLEEIEKYKEKVSSSIPSAKIFISEFSPAVGYATGKGTLGIGFFAK